MPWVDLLFVLFVAFYAYRGFHRGLIREGLDLFGFTVGVAAALRVYPYTGNIFAVFGLGEGWSNFLGGLIVFLIFVVTAGVVSARIHSHELFASGLALPVKAGGATFAALWSGLFAVFVMVVVTVIPSPPSAQAAVRDSLVGRGVLSSGSPLYSVLESYAKNDARNLLFFLRQYFAQLEPKSDSQEEFFQIQASNDIQLDPAAERVVLDLVNRERASRGLRALAPHKKIQTVARKHSTDMYRRGYFAHTNPDGQDPFDRMEAGGVRFKFAGENLALAPTVEMVHRGLMNSPRHRDNILKKEFTDLGVGIYKGPYGLMVTQNFCAGCR